MHIPILLALAFLLTIHFPVSSAEAAPDDAGLTEEAEEAAFIESIQNYQLRPSDMIRVSIFQEPDLGKELRIESDGSITLPLIGRIEIGGKTVQETQELIYELYNRDYLVNPQVGVTVLEFRGNMVRVLGQVARPGMVSIPHDRELTLLDAISAANGLTLRARGSRVQVRRLDDEGNVRRFVVNLDEILNDPEANDLVLNPDDTIFVPERPF